MAIGVSFVPTASGQGQTPDAPGSVSPIQKAIQFLSLRLPRVVGAGQVVPTQLLAGPAGGGVPGAAGAGDFGGGNGTSATAPPTFSMPGENPNQSSPVTPPNLSSVIAGQPGSAAAMIQAIDQATLPGVKKKKEMGGGLPGVPGFPAPDAAAPLPQPTSPQLLPQPNTAMELGSAVQIPKFSFTQRPGFPFGIGGGTPGA